MSRRARTSADSADVWPTWVRATVLVALVLVVGIGVVVALYDRGLLALTGPLVVLVAAPAVGLAGIAVARRRWSSQQRRTGELLSQLVDLLEAELDQDQDHRHSRADDGQVRAALRRAREARAQLAWGRGQGVAELEKLVRTARSWPPGTPLSTAAARLDRESARLRRTESWLERLRASRARRSGSEPGRQSS